MRRAAVQLGRQTDGDRPTLVALMMKSTSDRLKGRSSFEFPLKLNIAITSVPGGHCSCEKFATLHFSISVILDSKYD